MLLSQNLKPTSFFVRTLALLLLMTGLIGCEKAQQDKQAPAQAAPSLTVALAAAEVTQLPNLVMLSGAVAPVQEMQLGVELSGLRVQQLKVEVGDRVQRGDELLRLDARGVRTELLQAQAALKEAQAWVALSNSNVARGMALSERKLISARDLDDLKSVQVQANARLSTTEAQLAATELRLEYTVLRAPEPGVISARSVESGQVVMAGGELFRMIRRGQLEWRAEVNERDLLLLKVGMPAQVKLSDGSYLEGTVRNLSPTLDARTRTAIAYIDVPENRAVRAGMYLDGSVQLATREALTVPSAAIVRRDGMTFVFVLQGDLVREQRVEISGQSNALAIVQSGLSAGAQVVSEGAAFLSDGDRVRVAQKVPTVEGGSANPGAGL